MRKPNADRHNPSPDYLRELIARAGLTQRGAARQLGVDERTMRNYLAPKKERSKCPYPVQYCLEVLAN